MKVLKRLFQWEAENLPRSTESDLDFGKGEFAGIIGPSGSGKTTLLNIIGSLDAPSEGKVMVMGNSVGDLSAKQSACLRKSQLGFIFQSYNLLHVHTVFENVEFPLLLLKIEDRKRKTNDPGCPGMGWA